VCLGSGLLTAGALLVEGVEDGRQTLSTVDDLRWLRALPVHVDNEMRVLGEQRLLPVWETTVGAVSVGIERLVDRQAVGLLLGSDRV
jgi:hypothetical protein